MTRNVQFHSAAPLIKYHQKTFNGCCLNSLAYAFQCINDNRAVPALVNSIEESFNLQTKDCKNIIHFATIIMKNRIKIKCEMSLGYILTIWR